VCLYANVLASGKVKGQEKRSLYANTVGSKTYQDDSELSLVVEIVAAECPTISGAVEVAVVECSSMSDSVEISAVGCQVSVEIAVVDCPTVSGAVELVLGCPAMPGSDEVSAVDCPTIFQQYRCPHQSLSDHQRSEKTRPASAAATTQSSW